MKAQAQLQMRRAVSRSMVMSVGSSSYCGKTAHSASTLQHCQSASKHSPARRCQDVLRDARLIGRSTIDRADFRQRDSVRAELQGERSRCRRVRAMAGPHLEFRMRTETNVCAIL